MGIFSRSCLLGVFIALGLALGQRAGHAEETRFALVIGNDEYKTAKPATPANDAGLVANALQAAGFTVTGARNLDQATLRESFREFLGQVAAAGPDAVALIYLAGFGLQFEGENYFVPVDADIQHDADVPLQAVRVSDFLQPLASLPGRVKIVVLDAARPNQFARGGLPLASGLALVDPVRGMAIAFNAAPGTVAPEEPGPYGAYANALTEMIAAGGLSLDDLFARLRLRVSDLTKGAEVPWYTSQIDGPFFLTERTAGAPPPPNAMPLADIRAKPMRDFGSVEDAYAAAIALDTLDAYEQFLAMYPDSPFSRRIAAMLAVRREEMIWRRCVMADTPPAYWSYLRRYPRGPHVWDARRRLAILAAMAEPPPDFAFIDFGVPPPPPDEMGFIDQPVLMFIGPAFLPPPPPPLFFLPPRPREFVVLPPPPPPGGRFLLPVAAAAAAAVVPAFVRPPRTVVVRPAPGGGPVPGPGGRPFTAVSLPTAVSKTAPVGPGASPGLVPGPGAAGAPGFRAPLPGRPGGPTPPPPPPTAAVKPAPLPTPPGAPSAATVSPGAPQPHPGALTPANVKPVPPPPPPAGATTTAIKPAPPPPPSPPPATPAPALVKPTPPPPPPPPHPTTPTQTTVKPATPPSPPPPHPTTPVAGTVKPAPAKPCPPGTKPTPQGCK